jgi:hypothetical protein
MNDKANEALMHALLLAPAKREKQASPLREVCWVHWADRTTFSRSGIDLYSVGNMVGVSLRDMFDPRMVMKGKRR